MKSANFSWMKDQRKRLGITQEELSSKLQLAGFDTTRSAVASWESGKHQPRMDNIQLLETLSEILNISMDEIFVRSGYPITSNESQSEIAVRIGIIASHLPEKWQKHALEYIQSLEKNVTV